MNEVLKQINITYHPAQDRLLLRASAGNQKEFRLWLTRRYSALLLQALCTQMDKAGGIQNLSSNHNTREHFKQGAFDKNYQGDNIQTYPLGEAGALGFRINVGDYTAGVSTMQLLPEQGQGLNLNLDSSLLYLLFNLLEQAIIQADWRLPLPTDHKNAVH